VLPTVISILPLILQVQEVADQDFAAQAKKALVLLKYVIMPENVLGSIVDSAETSVGHQFWHTRAATLNYLESFAFKHTLILRPALTARLRICVFKLLSDPQLEVRTHASATLSGLLRLADEDFVKEVESKSLAGAAEAQAFAAHERKRQRLKRNASGPALSLQSKGATTGATTGAQAGKVEGSSLAERHGTLLGLRALVLTAPYDVPEFLPQVLVALSKSASEPPGPIRDTVTNTLAEFKKTHQDVWAQTKAAFSEDEWNDFNDHSLSPSYYV